MRITDRTGPRWRAELEGYDDLITVRAAGEYEFIDDTGDVWVDPDALAAIGVIDESVVNHEWQLGPHLFDYQAWIVARALDRQRFALFADTGLGKTAMQLDWAVNVARITEGKVLILAPLSVCRQTCVEAARFYGAPIVTNLTNRDVLDSWIADPDAEAAIGITNYEKFDGTGPGDRWGGESLPVAGVVLDESSMLKSFGSRKFAVMRAFAGVRWKLACSATPAPNQRTEFAQHAVFLDQVRSTTEYLTAYFMNRDGDWQFKPHSREAWAANLSSWAVFVRDPKRWGFADHLSELPKMSEVFPQVPLTEEQVAAARIHETGDQPSLFGATPGGVTSRTKMMQIAHGFELADGKVAHRYPTHKPQWIADLVNGQHADDQVIVWVTFDEEGDQLAELIPGARHLSGKTKPADRDKAVEGFRAADPDSPRVLILKPAMFGFGVNLQACSVQVFSTITDSFERYYQCIRRSYRFGQTKPVRVYVPLTALDEAICQNVMNKQSTFKSDADEIETAVVERLRPRDTSEVRIVSTAPKAELDRKEGETWTMIYGDSLAHMAHMAPQSVDLSVFSPPFAALYSYSQELEDMGNVRGDAEFRYQWRTFAERLLPVMKPGRVVAIHCKEIIRFANTSGYRHAYDFPSDLRAGMVDAGFHYHRRITIEKNPQLEATRNKETSLLHVTALRDAANSFPQTGEYLMVFSAPGANEVPVIHSRDEHSFERHTKWMNSIWYEPEDPAAIEVEMWRQWIYPDGAQSTWHGIRETDVLNAQVAKERPEERHVCPLQLSLIERTCLLWSNPGELVFSPFGGIGSEGWAAMGVGRRFYGCELKRSYFDTACRNLANREAEMVTKLSLFDEAS
jgi:DNA modification methylase